MRPYPGKEIREEESAYNCRHSRARRTIENAFGIMATRWRILNNPINALVENIEKYVMAIMVLHMVIILGQLKMQHTVRKDFLTQLLPVEILFQVIGGL